MRRAGIGGPGSKKDEARPSWADQQEYQFAGFRNDRAGDQRDPCLWELNAGSRWNGEDGRVQTPAGRNGIGFRGGLFSPP